MARRRIAFITGTRAEFGLMRSTLRAIAAHPKLELQLIVTGVHLDRKRGYTLNEIRREGWPVSAIVPWRNDSPLAIATGHATAGIGAALERLRSDVALVVGDRVEALAGATAGHLSGRCVAHVHGGDRAEGQVDDAIRHAITKLAHVHFAATAASGKRIWRLGEERERIHVVGTPGLDEVESVVGGRRSVAGRGAIIAYHPTDSRPAVEQRNATTILAAVSRFGFESIFLLAPNNDPGSAGILAAWEKARGRRGVEIIAHWQRDEYLRRLADAAVLIGNSSSGIIEAASLGTYVVDIGPRQRGRERSANVTHCEHDQAAIEAAIGKATRGGAKKVFRGRNVYGTGGAGVRIAELLAGVDCGSGNLRKLIRY